MILILRVCQTVITWKTWKSTITINIILLNVTLTIDIIHIIITVTRTRPLAQVVHTHPVPKVVVWFNLTIARWFSAIWQIPISVFNNHQHHHHHGHHPQHHLDVKRKMSRGAELAQSVITSLVMIQMMLMKLLAFMIIQNYFALYEKVC